MKKIQKKILLIIALFALAIFSIVYGYNKFTWKEAQIEHLVLDMNKAYHEAPPVVYLMNRNGVGFDFSTPYRAKISADSTLIRFDFGEKKELRKIRLYFEKKVESLIINNIALINKEDNYNLALDKLLPRDNLKIISSSSNSIEVDVLAPNGYLETPDHFLYDNDKAAMFQVGFGLFLFLLGLFFSSQKLVLKQSFNNPSITDLSVVIFVCSIFLPHPICNITLILSLLIVIKNFRIKQFVSSKINILFMLCFLVLFVNDMMIAESGYHNLKSTETYLPLFILPIYISSIKTSKSLKYLPVSAIVLGIVMFLTSFLDAVMFQNISYFSFDEFAKFTHPVYYSYLASFSIFYVFLYAKIDRFYKVLIQGILFFFLILAGSKLVITLTFIVYAILILKNRKAAFIMFGGLVLMAFFPPVQKRFNEILNVDDLSVINEKVIIDNNDSRVNGLTLRLLLWQESINVVETVPEIIYGKGVGKSTDELLKANLVKRGLVKYQRFSTHNQFINIFMRAGLIGVLSLLLVIGHGFYMAIKNKNKMLLIMVIMFTFAMLTESVFQRVLGIYFFTAVLLFLMKTNFLNEQVSHDECED